VRQARVRVADNFHVLAGPFKGVPVLKPAPDAVVRLVEYCRRLAQAVILDMPYTYDELYFQAMATADQVVLVAEQNVPAIQALKTLRETFQQAEAPAGLYVVLNRYDPRLKEFTVERLEQLLHLPHIYPVANDWSHCAEALNSGQLLRQTAKHSPALADIDDLVDALTGHEPAKRSSWSWLRFLQRLMPAER